jgi:hypothetical protein
MAMSKAKLREWPWNNQPSKRHVWKLVRMSERTGAVEHCQRCGAHFVERADTRGPVYCYATAEWMAGHPEDDGKEG